jgi:hypothetical protein
MLESGRINIVKMAILQKAINMFNAIPMKIPILSKKSNARSIRIPDFNVYYRPIIIKTACY